MSSVVAFLRRHYKLLLVLLAAFILRLVLLLKDGDFWMDEMFSFTYSQKPWLDSIFHYWVWETNPPLHMLLIKLWLYLLPANEFWARFPSIVVSLAAVVYTYKLGKRLYNETVALLAALILAFLPIYLFYSITNRTYALSVFLVVLSFNYFLDVFWDNRTERTYYIGYILTTTLLLYSHLTAVGLVVCEALIVFIFQRPAIRKWLLYTAGAVLAWSLWAVPSLMGKFNHTTIGKTWFFNVDTTLQNLVINLQRLTLGPRQVSYASYIFLLIFVALWICCGYRRRANTATLTSYGMITILLFLPLATATALGLIETKFFMLTAPWFALALAYLTSELFTYPPLAMLMCALLFYRGLMNVYTHLPLSNWQTLNQYLATYYTTSTSQILIYDNFTNKNEIDRYLRIRLRAIPYMNTTTLSWDRFLITQNYLYQYHSDAEIHNWLQREHITAYPEIFAMQYPSNVFINIDLASALRAAGYEAVTPTGTIAVENRPTIRLYRKKL